MTFIIIINLFLYFSVFTSLDLQLLFDSSSLLVILNVVVTLLMTLFMTAIVMIMIIIIMIMINDLVFSLLVSKLSLFTILTNEVNDNYFMK